MSASADLAALFELVVRDLADDAPRFVLADRWLELHDPRGELVTLQLRKTSTAEDLEKIRAIVWYDRDWLGELALVTRARVYVRGFLDELELPPPAAATPERWRAATRNPNLRTVRRIRVGAGSELDYRAFLFSPEMRNLEDAEVTSLALFREVLEASSLRKLRRLTLLPTFAHAAVRDAVVAATARPGLERITVIGGNPTSLLPLATETTSVAVTSDELMVLATRTKECLLIQGDNAERIVRSIRRSRPKETVRVVSR